MKLNFKAALLLAGLVTVPFSAAYASGIFDTYPVLGSAAVCSSTSTGVSGQVCTTTTPAGPTAITGAETIPADTNLTQGRNPQTIQIPMAALNALPIAYTTTLTPATATNTITAVSSDGGVVIIGSAALSPTTITLPPSPLDGQQYRISSTQTIATLTVSGATGATVNTAPTAITPSATASYGYTLRYRATTATTGVWYRLQ